MTDAALDQLAEQQFLGQRLLDVLLDHAGERPRAVQPVVAALGQPFLGRRGQLDRHVAVGELGLELHDELLDHAADDLRRQAGEGDDRRPAGCGIPA